MQVRQLRLLQGGGVRDGDRPGRQVLVAGHPGDGRGDASLTDAELEALAALAGHARRRPPRDLR